MKVIRNVPNLFKDKIMGYIEFELFVTNIKEGVSVQDQSGTLENPFYDISNAMTKVFKNKS